MARVRPILYVGNRNYSSWSLRPWLLLAHFGVDFETRVVPLGTPAFAAEVPPVSPTGRVPALVHGDVNVWDSLAIAEYADEALLDGRGWPADRAARAHARAIVAEMHSGYAALREQCPMNIRRRLAVPLPIDARAERDVARVLAAWRTARERHGAGGPFLFGTFTIADAYFAPVVFRLRSYALPRDAESQRYMDAVIALPATQQWVAAGLAETERLEDTERVGRGLPELPA